MVVQCVNLEILSRKIDGLWHDGWRGYAPLIYENEQIVLHSETFVTGDGFHVDQVKYLGVKWFKTRRVSSSRKSSISERPRGTLPIISVECLWSLHTLAKEASCLLKAGIGKQSELTESQGESLALRPGRRPRLYSVAQPRWSTSLRTA
jgi:hypothetical protein